MFALLGVAFVSGAFGAEGRAKVSLLLESSTYKPGASIRAAIRMKYDDGWHGYWVNPGEGGMRTEAVWKLPAGWQAGDLEFPAPRRFESGLLVSFGYEDEVVLPVTIRPPSGADGTAELAVKVTWLACNANSCETGTAELSANLRPGPADAGPDAVAVAKAHESLPSIDLGLKLDVAESTDAIRLLLSGATAASLSGAEILPITEQVLDTAKRIELRGDGSTARAIAARSPYASGPVRDLKILIFGGKLRKPVIAVWTASK
ncbi:MAG: hypothetical protein J0M04_08060 [Verrucomicrobia bacterium]|nr:hypothetical protein [Verrucomicrobiota bacterium]